MMNDQRRCVVEPNFGSVCGFAPGHGGDHGTYDQKKGAWVEWRLEVQCGIVNPRKDWVCERPKGHSGSHKTRNESGDDWYDWQVELDPPPSDRAFETIPMFPVPVINAADPEPGEVVLTWTPPVLSGIVRYVKLEGPDHVCKVPDADQFGGGTVHRCECCGQYRRVKLLPLDVKRVRKGLFGKSYEQDARMWEGISEERALELIAEATD